jgi:hypothetical protein
MLTEQFLYQQIYNTDTTITIHKISVVYKDGVELSRSQPHTKTLTPVDDYSDEDSDTRRMCKALWTKDIVAAYKKLLYKAR